MADKGEDANKGNHHENKTAGVRMVDANWVMAANTKHYDVRTTEKQAKKAAKEAIAQGYQPHQTPCATGSGQVDESKGVGGRRHRKKKRQQRNHKQKTMVEHAIESYLIFYNLPPNSVNEGTLRGTSAGQEDQLEQWAKLRSQLTPQQVEEWKHHWI